MNGQRQESASPADLVVAIANRIVRTETVIERYRTIIDAPLSPKYASDPQVTDPFQAMGTHVVQAGKFVAEARKHMRGLGLSMLDELVSGAAHGDPTTQVLEVGYRVLVKLGAGDRELTHAAHCLRQVEDRVACDGKGR
jgi:hypothetical protein